MDRESALELLARLRLGREEYLQRLMSQLILAAPYPPWNVRSRPSQRGTAFLRALDALSFGTSSATDDCDFVDEFELPRAVDDAKAGFPDWACLWSQRLWMLELKTEIGSHRPDQLPYYLQLASHHYPTCGVDLTYVTPLMPTPAIAVAEGQRFAHLTWAQVLDVARETWDDSDNAVDHDLLDMAQDVVESFGSNWPLWRAARLGVSAEAPEPPTFDPVDETLSLVERTASDGVQRVLDVEFASPDELEEIRIGVRDQLKALPEGDPKRFVRPWMWSANTSGGAALSSGGEETGYELRISRYEKPI